MSASPDAVVPITGLIGDLPAEYAVRLGGKVLPGRFADPVEAAAHLGHLLEWRRTGKCPIVVEKGAEPKAPEAPA